jgi:SAM-dependent methyltransferase
LKLISLGKLLLKFNFKYASELFFWIREIDQYIKWYQGSRSSLYGVMAPRDEEKITEFNLRENAIRTWIRLDATKYLQHLRIPSDYFKGQRILDVGCGPIPYALAFENCDIVGVDPLIDYYREIGYPMKKYSERIKYVHSPIESVPYPDDSFDAVISVNALDHVDNFQKASEEILRLLKPKGVVVLEVHNHSPRIGHPWKLSDEIIRDSFSSISIRKVFENRFSDFYDIPEHQEEMLSVWSNISFHVKSG